MRSEQFGSLKISGVGPGRAIGLEYTQCTISLWDKRYVIMPSVNFYFPLPGCLDCVLLVPDANKPYISSGFDSHAENEKCLGDYYFLSPRIAYNIHDSKPLNLNS